MSSDETLDPVLVDLVARALHDHAPMADPNGPEGSTTTWGSMPEMVRDDYRSEARAVLTALSAAGRLLPGGGEHRVELGFGTARAPAVGPVQTWWADQGQHLTWIPKWRRTVTTFPDGSVLTGLWTQIDAPAPTKPAEGGAVKGCPTCHGLTRIDGCQNLWHIETRPDLGALRRANPALGRTVSDAAFVEAMRTESGAAWSVPVEDPPAGTPDLMAALRGSIDRAKAARKPVEEGDRG